MKSLISLISGLVLSPALFAQITVNGDSYPDLFGPVGSNVTVNPTNSLVLTLGGSASGSLGTHWTATANGGASVLLGVSETGAQVALTGSALQFNVKNTGLVGDLLDAGLTGLSASWSATAKFDSPGNQLLLQPNTVYQVHFDVDGSNGLLNSTLGILPSFHVELLDGSNNQIGSAGHGTLVNIVGLLGTGVPSGSATVNFVTGNTVGSGPASLRFTGNATLNATALGLGTNFATVSGVTITPVPEPSSLLLLGLGSLALLRRKR